MNNTIKESINKSKILVEALPYIKHFQGITVVIKYGGSALVDDKVKDTIMQDIALMKMVGFKPVLVHGGGAEINKMLDRLDIESEFKDGLRVTSNETMEVVEMVLSGKLNKKIVTDLNLQGVKAVGISGKDADMMHVKKLMPNGNDIGCVGEVKHIDTSLIKTLVDNDFVPVIAPIGTDSKGNTFNINADYAAVAVAGALNADKLVFLTDVSGVLRNVDDPDSLITRVNPEEIERLLEDGTISGGMIPKIQCAMAGVDAGANHVHILDGRLEHCLVLEIFTKDGIGTMIESQ